MDPQLQADDLMGALEAVSKKLKETMGGSGTNQPKTLKDLADPDIRTMLGHLRDVLHVVLTEQSSIIQKVDTLTSQNEELSVKLVSLEIGKADYKLR